MQALLASTAVLLAGFIVGQHLVGVTRQPLPLIWPLGVLLVLAAQLPLREIFGLAERVATRSLLTRALRAGFTLLIITIASAVNVATHADPVLQVFLLLLVAVGFATAAVTRTEPWALTLALGMGWVGLQFVTPLGQQMGAFLEDVGLVIATALVIVAAALYVIVDLPIRDRQLRPLWGHRRNK
jgi:hypothetical protein